MAQIKAKFAIRNLSLQKTLVLLTVLTALAVVILVPFEADLFQQLYDKVEDPYLGSKELVEGSGMYMNYYIVEPSGRDLFLMKAIYTARAVWCLGTIAGAVVLEAVLFYRLKLKKPLALLSDASEKIEKNDLNFTLQYPCGDEMGALCSSFEKMRAALYENNQKMWRDMEERKRLNAAFSHDLRTPLTVLRGYADLLKNYVPRDQIPKEKLVNTVDTMGRHISRLENYVTGMNRLQKLSDIEPANRVIDPEVLRQEISEAARFVFSPAGIQNEIVFRITDGKLFGDLSLILQVYENLIANAVRYARETVTVTVEREDIYLALTVRDDGEGFDSEELKNADKPYFHGNEEGGLHFGLGLNICKILCEKCGGSLILENAPEGGAAVTAFFTI